MRQKKWAALLSIIIFIASLVSLGFYGLNLGLDFTGGTQVEVTFQQPVNTQAIRQNLAKQGFPEAVVQAYDVRDISVRVGTHKELTSEVLKAKLMAAMPGGNIVQLDYIGPQVGKSLMTNGILAILVALIGTMIYIALRFEMRFALSAAVALIHDPILILGIFSFFHLEFTLIVLGGVLFVIGYSLNDTIVVYDRVRENFRKVRKGTPTEIMDLSINQTLSRTIMTSGLTLIVVVSLFLFGGEVLREFSLALIIGIVIGTYSSIYIAGSLAVALGLNRAHLMKAPRKTEDEMP